MRLRRKVGAFLGALLVAFGVGAVATPASAAAAFSGPYTIRPSGGGSKCLDVEGVSRANGAYLQLYDCLGAFQTNQQFYLYLVPGTGNRYQIVARHSGKCLDVEGVSHDPGAQIQQYDCLGYGQSNQIFIVAPDPYNGSRYALIPWHSLQQVTYQGLFNGAAVFQWPTGGGPYWTIP